MREREIRSKNAFRILHVIEEVYVVLWYYSLFNRETVCSLVGAVGSVLLAYKLRVPYLILSSQALALFLWVSSGFSDVLPLPKSMQVGGLAMLNSTSVRI